MHCNKCGKEISSCCKFCSWCGQPQDSINKNVESKPKKRLIILVSVPLCIVLITMFVANSIGYLDGIKQSLHIISSNDVIKTNYSEAFKQVEQTSSRLSILLISTKYGGKTKTVSELKLVEILKEDKLKITNTYNKLNELNVPIKMKDYHNYMLKSLKGTITNLDTIIRLGTSDKNMLQTTFINSNLREFDSCAENIKQFKDKYNEIGTKLPK